MAVLVNVRRTYPLVASGALDEAVAVLGDWSGLGDKALAHNADIVVGLAPVGSDGREAIVAVYDVVANEDGRRWLRTEEDKVRFVGERSEKFAYLLGHEMPVPVFSRQGMARAAVYLPTHELPAPPVAAVPAEDDAVVSVHGLTIRREVSGQLVIEVPAGRQVTVVAVAA